MEDMNEQTWQSQIAVPASVMTLEDLQQSHAAIFDFAVKSVRKSMSDIIVALQVLEGDFCDKIFDIQKEQTLVMTRSPMPSQATIADFFANVTKVEQKLQVYESHAANLAHVKLTLARIAELVTKDGVLGTLVQKKTPVSTSFACSPTVQQQSLHLSRYSYPPIGPSLLFSAPSAPASMLPTNCFGQLVKPNDKHPGNTCFVFYLPPEANNDNLRTLFARYGTVLNTYVAIDKMTNRTRGFGFVDFSSAAEAQTAVAQLDKYQWCGKFLSVSIKL